MQVADKIEQYRKDGRPVAGCCVEPIQSAGGDNHASPGFFQQLQQICKQVRHFLFHPVYLKKKIWTPWTIYFYFHRTSLKITSMNVIYRAGAVT